MRWVSLGRGPAGSCALGDRAPFFGGSATLSPLPSNNNVAPLVAQTGAAELIAVGRTMEDPHHPIIERPWEFEIGDFRYFSGRDGTEAFIDLILVNGPEVRRLRFWSPRDLAIERGFPLATHGMVILDVSARQLDGIRVHVADFEASEGSIEFWARDVIDLDATPNSRLHRAARAAGEA